MKIERVADLVAEIRTLNLWTEVRELPLDQHVLWRRAAWWKLIIELLPNKNVKGSDVGVYRFEVFVHRPEFWILENATFRKLNLFPSSSEREKTSPGPVIEVSSFWGTQQSMCLLALTWRWNRIQLPKSTKSRNLVILSSTKLHGVETQWFGVLQNCMVLKPSDSVFYQTAWCWNPVILSSNKLHGVETQWFWVLPNFMVLKPSDSELYQTAWCWNLVILSSTKLHGVETQWLWVLPNCTVLKPSDSEFYQTAWRLHTKLPYCLNKELWNVPLYGLQ
jgi:hypothetical protein